MTGAFRTKGARRLPGHPMYGRVQTLTEYHVGGVGWGHGSWCILLCTMLNASSTRCQVNHITVEGRAESASVGCDGHLGLQRFEMGQCLAGLSHR